MTETALRDDELKELASVIAPGPAADLVLRKAGFPREAMPAVQGSTRREFWAQIGDAVESGILFDGRRRILAAAHDLFRDNPIFSRAGQDDEQQKSDAVRVLVVGVGLGSPGAAGPGQSSIRADRESKLILGAAALGHLKVEIRPAATVDDLDAMLGVRPDILHLICHGDGQNLTFADGYGDPRRVPAEHVARLLAGYRAHAGIQLTGMVLNACHSAAIAETFAPVADTVVAHHGSLEDECAQLFSERLYKTLRDVPSLGGAARIASEHLAADGSGCGGIQDGLVIVTGKTEHENR